jgi:hypothetical protein
VCVCVLCLCALFGCVGPNWVGVGVCVCVGEVWLLIRQVK